MEYSLIGTTNWPELEKRVNDQISHGWQPQGGVSILDESVSNTWKLRFFQAMTRVAAKPYPTVKIDLND